MNKEHIKIKVNNQQEAEMFKAILVEMGEPIGSNFYLGMEDEDALTFSDGAWCVVVSMEQQTELSEVSMLEFLAYITATKYALLCQRLTGGYTVDELKSPLPLQPKQPKQDTINNSDRYAVLVTSSKQADLVCKHFNFPAVPVNTEGNELWLTNDQAFYLEYNEVETDGYDVISFADFAKLKGIENRYYFGRSFDDVDLFAGDLMHVVEQIDQFNFDFSGSWNVIEGGKQMKGHFYFHNKDAALAFVKGNNKPQQIRLFEGEQCEVLVTMHGVEFDFNRAHYTSKNSDVRKANICFFTEAELLQVMDAVNSFK